MAGTKSIKNWSEDERPREKMLQKGAGALTNAELLAILISSGTKERSALDLARDMLALAQNNLLELGRLNVPELQKIKGIGEARAITICAAMELGRRRQVGEGIERAAIDKPAAAARIIIPLLQDYNHEVFCILYLNYASKYIRHEILSSGGINATVADVRMILKNCLLYNASKIVVAHNHPSGSLKPSDADKALTIQIADAAKLLNMQLMDHIIVAGNNYFSFADTGML